MIVDDILLSELYRSTTFASNDDNEEEEMIRQLLL